MPHWLGLTDVPLFVSRRRLAGRKSFPRAAGSWALDSGGFTELQMFGRWTVSAPEYAAEVQRYADAVGGMDWAAPQDWMCEPVVLQGGKVGPVTFVGTGLSVAEHQRRTVANYIDLRALAPDVPWIPVLQGWRQDDYHQCWSLYDAAGVDLTACETVGVGSVCRRQNTAEAAAIFRSLRPLKLHGFGVKKIGLYQCSDLLASSDSMAWSYGAYRHGRPLCGGSGHKTCANCIDYALWWRGRVIAGLDNDSGEQLGLFA